MEKEFIIEFIPYELALRMKQLGFNEPGIASRDMGNGQGLIQIPLYQQAFRWFREKYHIHGEPFYKGGSTKQTSWYDYKIYSTIDWICNNPKQQWKTYEESQLECLKKLIEIVKNKEK